MSPSIPGMRRLPLHPPDLCGMQASDALLHLLEICCYGPLLSLLLAFVAVGKRGMGVLRADKMGTGARLQHHICRHGLGGAVMHMWRSLACCYCLLLLGGVVCVAE